ncbi:MAG: DUF2723 domain-containing protein [Prevotella sp.]|nr:DUF2723 domain-containing protein [Bacteroides sp.]MCM1365715.1 DUF2723 domain-containing protein [Prevotella sp.]MCM1436385.1 DUF2723 domain-containing protein [Prevotella sp.]
MKIDEKILRRLVATGVFLVAMIVYTLTVEPTASFWDCPEYIANAVMLEIGHPPGNPTWALAARTFASLAPCKEFAPLFVNLSSAVFTSLAAMLLYLSVVLLIGRRKSKGGDVDPLPHIAGVISALTFAFLDSTWFSAVEAEVYACSIFCTALCFWLILLWRKSRSPRILILIAYITGLSIGVHQLNLLCIPTIALVILFARHRRGVSFWKTSGVLIISFVVIAAILFGMMPGMTTLASETELYITSHFPTGFNTGVLSYVCVAFVIVVASAVILPLSRSKWLDAALIAASLFISGMTSLGGDIILGSIVAVCCGLGFLVYPQRLLRLASVTLWCVAFLMLGFCSFALIIIRANAFPPMNQGNPSNIFAFSSYLHRDQYGSTPLLYGRTPQSKMLREERFTVNNEGDTIPDYSALARKKKRARIYPAVAGACINNVSGFMTAADSTFNERQYDSAGNHYVVADYNYDYLYAQELDMWFPRITSSNPDHVEAYDSWIGMNSSTMMSVKASEAVDSLGHPVGKLDKFTGKRIKRDAQRPTYLQNLEALLSYQMFYMYFRYVMWNFVGRQNDVPSQGQVDTGNFITGIDFLDREMLGPQNALPFYYGMKNPGRNPYYFLPLIFVFLGMIWLVRRGRRGDRVLYMLLLLFFMTGPAIVLYLNQSPCEPRERDYSFIGSFYALSFFVGIGAMGTVRHIASRFETRGRRKKALIIGCVASFAIPGMLLATNYDDHDRSSRTLTSDMAYNTLASMLPDAIIFVNGDNFTFPLWYSQEVEGVREDVSIINLAYLGTDWYPVQLLSANRKGKRLPMFATEKNLAYNTLSSAYIPADTTAVDAKRAFLYMYNSSPSSGFRFPSSRIRIPKGESGDSLIVDLKKVSGGKSYVMRSNIVMLDIIAANAYQPEQRPVYWSAALPDSHKGAFAPLSRYDGLVSQLSDTASVNTPPDPFRLANFLIYDARYGNLNSVSIIDEPGKGQVRLLRRALRISAAKMLDERKPDIALQLLDIHQKKLPAALVPYTIYNDRYLQRDEAEETALLLMRCSKALNRPELHRDALEILKRQITTLATWRNYYNLLAPRLRGVTSPIVNISAHGVYAPIDAYLNNGGEPEFIRQHRLLKPINLENEKKDWKIRELRRQLLRDARYPEHSDSTKLHLDNYFKAGGKSADLLKYSEIRGAADFPPIPEK